MSQPQPLQDDYSVRRRIVLTPTTPGFTPPQPLVVGRVAAGDVVEQGFAFVTKPWNGKTPTAKLIAMSHATSTALAEVALGAELGTDVFGDGKWILDRGAAHSYLVTAVEDLALVVDDGRGAAPGSTTGELVLFLSLMRRGPTP